MLASVRKFFETRIAQPAEEERDPESREHGYRLATAALLIEMSRADREVTDDERAAVTDAVQRAFGLPESETSELVRLAEAEARESTSLYEFTSLINAHFDDTEKAHVVELLWRVAYADGDVDKHEEHLVRKVADLIHVPHSVFIREKHRVADGPDGRQPKHRNTPTP